MNKRKNIVAAAMLIFSAGMVNPAQAQVTTVDPAHISADAMSWMSNFAQWMKEIESWKTQFDQMKAKFESMNKGEFKMDGMDIANDDSDSSSEDDSTLDNKNYTDEGTYNALVTSLTAEQEVPLLQCSGMGKMDCTAAMKNVTKTCEIIADKLSLNLCRLQGVLEYEAHLEFVEGKSKYATYVKKIKDKEKELQSYGNSGSSGSSSSDSSTGSTSDSQNDGKWKSKATEISVLQREMGNYEKNAQSRADTLSKSIEVVKQKRAARAEELISRNQNTSNVANGVLTTLIEKASENRTDADSASRTY